MRAHDRARTYGTISAMTSPVGLHRVLEPVGVLPQAAWRVDPDPTLGRDEVRVSVETAQPRCGQLSPAGGEARGGPRRAARRGPRDRQLARGKMQNPVTGSGGMLVGVVDEVGPDSPLGLKARGTGRLARLPVADPAAHHRRPGPLGRLAPSRSPVRAPRSSSAGPSPPCCRTTCGDELAIAVMDVAGAPGPDGEGGRAAHRRARVGDGRRPRGSRQERIPDPGGGPTSRCASHRGHRPHRVRVRAAHLQRARGRRRHRRRA